MTIIMTFTMPVTLRTMLTLFEHAISCSFSVPPVTPASVHDYYQDSIKWMKEVQKYKWVYANNLLILLLEFSRVR